MSKPALFVPRLLCSAALLLLACTAARAELQPLLLDFNELPDSPIGSHLPENYAGFVWGDRWYQMSPAAGATDQNFLASSTVGSTLLRRVDRGAFYFDGADFWSRRGLDANGDFFFVLYGQQGQVLYNGNLDGNAGRMRFTGTPQTLAANYSGAIYAMAWGFDNDDYDHLAMDNLRFRVEANAPVPEPASGLLAGLGLAVLLSARRLQTGARS